MVATDARVTEELPSVPTPGTLPAPPRFAALDAFRAVGALMVVATHVAFVTGRTEKGAFSALLGRLDAGVAVFFVLSGFLLFRPYAAAAAGSGAAVSTRRYLIRRAGRILPAYWLLVVISLLLLDSNDDASLADWARHLTLTQIYDPAELRDGLAQAWSLCTEVTFYIVLPLLAVATLRRRKDGSWRPGLAVGLLGLALPIGVGWQILTRETRWFDLFISGFWLPAYTPWFAAGMALAVVHVAYAEGRTGAWRAIAELGAAPLACWSVAFALFAVASTPLAGPRPLAGLPTAMESSFRLLLYGGFALFLVLPAVFVPPEGRRTVSLLASRPVGYLGKISYSIFLWHLLVLDYLRHRLDIPDFGGNWFQLFSLTVAGTLVVSVLSYHVVEEPLQRLTTRATRRLRKQPTALPAQPAREPA